MAAPLTFDQIIALANDKHGSRYDYSLISPDVKRSDVVRIICPEHGEYTCKMATHLVGHGKCPQCNSIKHEARTQARFKHKDYYIDRAIAVHGTLYDYSQLEEYPSFASKRATIICKEHGPFKQLLSHHITNGAGCPTCGDIQRAKKTQKGADFYLNKVKADSKYDYSLVPKDAKSTDVVPIICPDHGTFNQLLSDHSVGRGCPKCAIDRRIEKAANNRKERRLQALLDDADWLAHKHHTEQLTMGEIAEVVGSTMSTVRVHAIKHGIDRLRFPKSSGEVKLAHEIQGLLGADNVMVNDRHIIHPQELDIYIPSHKLAIEYCGLYWHSDKFKDKNYHLQKLEACRRVGVRLITIFEDEWKNTPHLVLSKIKAILNINRGPKVHARKCWVIKLTRAQKKEFFDANHIQGSGPGSVTYGLQHNGSIIAAMTFIKQQGGRWDLNRYATAVNVPGGFTKLLTHFKRHHQWTEIVSFADRRWSEGGLYEKVGFVRDGVLPPDHSYVLNGTTRQHRFNFRHKHLPSILGDQYNPNETEFQNMDRSKYLRIWNCGLLRYVMTNPEVQ